MKQILKKRGIPSICGTVILIGVVLGITAPEDPDKIALEKLDNLNKIEAQLEADKMLKVLEEQKAKTEYEYKKQLREATEKQLQDNYKEQKMLYGISEPVIKEITNGVAEQNATAHDRNLMRKICDVKKNGKQSPLCNNWGLYMILKGISKQRGVEFGLMVGITYHESHIGINLNKEECASYNNRSGLKGFKSEDGKVVKNKYPDENGCYLYKFGSMEHYRASFAETISKGYIERGCSTPECISKRYVGTNGKVKAERSNSVKKFMNN